MVHAPRGCIFCTLMSLKGEPCAPSMSKNGSELMFATFKWKTRFLSQTSDSIGDGTVPSILLCIGSLFLGETPNSLIERGNQEKAKAMLKRIRGTENVDEEYQDLVDASEEASNVEHPCNNITQPEYSINVIMFYALVLFKILGFGDEASLMSAVISGGVNVVATLVYVFTVDKFGRRLLFFEGGSQMFIC
ncbi:sugar transporter [Medicago truncatula]|uniref:Sugar transporter n=1 Tax=Medicago truncatula TaxID=3880 RepID=G7IBF0_MEDTR|nr:sugar transporter [Medicago truncatula]